MIGEPEIHLFILWQRARIEEGRILQDMVHRFEVLAEIVVTWPPRHFVPNLSRFYGARLLLAADKAQHCGTGPFLAVVVEDSRASYGTRHTSTGVRCVNTNVFDAKTLYRAWTGGGHRIHSTDDPREATRDIVLLTGSLPEDFRTAATTAAHKLAPRRQIVGGLIGPDLGAQPGRRLGLSRGVAATNSRSFKGRLYTLIAGAPPLARAARALLRTWMAWAMVRDFDARTRRYLAGVGLREIRRFRVRSWWYGAAYYRASAPDGAALFVKVHRDPRVVARERRGLSLFGPRGTAPTLHDAATHDPHVVAMHHIEGPQVDRWIAAAPGDAAIVAVAAQLAEIVDALREAELAHRDVRPPNLLVTGAVASPHLTLIDFGYAVRPDSPEEIDDLAQDPPKVQARLGDRYRAHGNGWDDALSALAVLERDLLPAVTDPTLLDGPRAALERSVGRLVITQPGPDGSVGNPCGPR